ncbi:MAG: putative toxin-antitoxin system toxin component, PIN family [bacterium]
MRVVLDTNVVVSGLLNPYGASASILKLVLLKEIEIVFDARLLCEYKEVLLRPKFQFKESQVNDFIDGLLNTGLSILTKPLKASLPDVDDNPFLEIAIADGGAILVTGNKKHYPKELCQGVNVLTPQEFIQMYL